MKNESFTLSARGAFSYRWNKGLDSKEPYPTRLKCSIVAFMTALFHQYTVYEATIDETYLTTHTKSIFCKEYNTFKKRSVQPTDEQKLTPWHIQKNILKEELTKLKEINISAVEFEKLMLSDKFEDSAHYIVTGDIIFSPTDKKITLPKYLTVNGNVTLQGNTQLFNLPKIFVAKGKLDLAACTGLGDLSDTKLNVNDSLFFSDCINMTHPPILISEGINTIYFTRCSSLIKAPTYFFPPDSIPRIIVKGCDKLNDIEKNKLKGEDNNDVG